VSRRNGEEEVVKKVALDSNITGFGAHGSLVKTIKEETPRNIF